MWWKKQWICKSKSETKLESEFRWCIYIQSMNAMFTRLFSSHILLISVCLSSVTEPYLIAGRSFWRVRRTLLGAFALVYKWSNTLGTEIHSFFCTAVEILHFLSSRESMDNFDHSIISNFQNMSRPQDKCTICLEDLSSEEVVSFFKSPILVLFVSQNGNYTLHREFPTIQCATSCDHLFHSRCLREWFDSTLVRRTCPCCRADVVEIVTVPSQHGTPASFEIQQNEVCTFSSFFSIVKTGNLLKNYDSSEQKQFSNSATLQWQGIVGGSRRNGDCIEHLGSCVCWRGDFKTHKYCLLKNIVFILNDLSFHSSLWREIT